MENAEQIRPSASTVDTDGIDALFAVTAPSVEVVPVGDKIEVTVTEAAALLGISKRTMWRRIKAGEFGSRYDGKQSFVTIPASLENDTSQDNGAVNTRAVPRHIRVPEDELTKLKTDLERTKTELSAVTNRAQYLQGQVDLYEQHFKLLTDRTPRAGWWRRAWSALKGVSGG